jgi:hypothetical protein
MAVCGSDNDRAKLTPEQVIDIYLLARSKRYWQRELAEAFAITQSHVSLIMHRRRWQWLFNNKEHEMSNEEFEARLAASEKRVAELEKQLGEARKLPEVFKPEPRQPLDLTAGARMPKSVVKDMATDDKLFAGIIEDAYPSLRKGEVRIEQHKSAAGAVPQERSATPGYVDARPIWPPQGVNVWPKQEEK